MLFDARSTKSTINRNALARYDEHGEPIQAELQNGNANGSVSSRLGQEQDWEYP